MWNRICRYFSRAVAKYRLKREVAPEAFRATTAELRELAELAGRLRPADHEFHARIGHILQEMEQLDRLTGRNEFRRLPIEKRIELKQSLLKSRDQLLETVKSAPPPTPRLQ